MNVRKPALMAATLALAITPAMTAVSPVHAAPKAPVVAVAEESLFYQILAVFPPAMAEAAKAIFERGEFKQIFVLFQEALKLTPTEINTIFTKLQEILGGFTPPPPPEEPPAEQPPVEQPPAPTTTVNKKVAWTADAMLKDAGDKRTGAAAANILLQTALAGR